mgnify:CR=1 FL=1|tara:strand:- start:266 stop:577 length:312 start_codon:yes stop_codon:yes gene_type:complete
MKFCKIVLFLNIFLLFASCGTLKEGFKNQKKNNSDEFLVEKKSPLVMPPDYNDLPEPGDNQSETNLEENKIKKLLTNNDIETDKVENNSQNFEESFLEKIKNN